MSALTRADPEGILGFVADAGTVDFDRPYPPELLARLAGLVPCAGDEGPRGGGVGLDLVLREGEVDGQHHQALLRPVVEIALEPRGGAVAEISALEVLRVGN